MWRSKAFLLLFSCVFPACVCAALSRAARAAATGTPQSHMKCSGSNAQTRVCLFRDIYFDTQTAEFNFYTDGVFVRTLPAGTVTDDPDNRSAWLQMGRLPWDQESDRKYVFFVNWVTNSSAPSEACTIEQPVQLRTPFKAASFGHLLRDNYQALIENPLKWGRDPTNYMWVRWPSSAGFEAKYADTPSHVMAAYGSWLSRVETQSWEEVLDRCRPEGAEARYIRFPDMIAGNGGTNFISGSARAPHDGPNSCPRERWTSMRRVAYQLNGIAHQPVKDHGKVRLLFLGRTSGERRAISNIDALVPAMRARFPELQVDNAVLHSMKPKLQLEELARTSIFVTTVGSASFRMLYLPDGAIVILVGSPEGTIESNGHRVNLSPFHEVEQCWGHMGHITVLPYHVREGEYTKGRGREHMLQNGQQASYEYMRLWDADIQVQEDRLADLVEVAVRQIEMDAS